MSVYGMKTKTIRKVLFAKIANWISSIESPELRKLVAENVIVTGGSITSMLLGEDIKDFDVYFKTKEATIKVAEYYCAKFIEENKCEYFTPYVKVDEATGRVTIRIDGAGVAESNDAAGSEEEAYENDLLEGGADTIASHQKRQTPEEEEKDAKYRPVFLSDNAITLTNKVQLVIRFYGSPSEIHKNYDYAHATNVYDYDTNTLTLNQKATECTLSKTLLYTGSLYPICSLFRMRKFLDRGWRISAGEMVKMAFQISELDLSNLNVLKEQLTGVDMLYMRALISALNEFHEGNPDIAIDASVVVEIVDKIFND